MSDALTMTPGVPTAALVELRSWADRAGECLDSLADEIGLAAPQCSGTLPLQGFIQLQNSLNRLTEQLTPEDLKVAGQVLSLLSGWMDRPPIRLPTRGCLQDALRTVCSAINAHHERRLAEIETRPGFVGLVLDEGELTGTDGGGDYAHFTMETTLLSVHAVLRLIVPQAAAGGLRAVELRRTEGPSPVPFESFVETHYACSRAALLYDSAASERVLTFPPPSALGSQAIVDEQLRMLSGGIDERTIAGRVRLLIEEGTGDQSSIACALGMSVATLRRRLCEEGASFRLIRTQALEAKAETMLRSTAPLTQIASELGFADVRSFSRAYKSWTGLTPHERRLRDTA